MYCIHSTIFSIFIVMFLIKNNLISAKNVLENLLHHQFEQQKTKMSLLKQLLLKIDQEKAYQTCAIFQDNTTDYNVEEILQKYLKKPLIIYNNLSQQMDKCCGSHTIILAIAIWREESSEEFFEAIAESLNYKRQNRVLVIKDIEETNFSKKAMVNFFNLSMTYKFPDLVLIFKDYEKTKNLYQFQMFPRLRVKKMNLKFLNFSIYPNKFKNLYGYPLRSMPGQIIPEIALHIDERGDVQVKGYIMKFLQLFTKHLNATLVFPFKIIPDNSLFFYDFYNFTQNDLIDIPAGLVTYQNNNHLMSRIYEINKLCIMVPIEKPLTFKDYVDEHISRNFYIVFITDIFVFAVLLVLSTKVWSLKHKTSYTAKVNNIVLNSNACAGMIPGSFKMLPKPTISIRFIYICIFLCGLTYSIIVSVYMQSFLTHPHTNRIRTLRDLVNNNLKILVSREDLALVLNYIRISPNWLSLLFEITNDYREFSEIRASLNTSYAYPIMSPHWFMLSALQASRNKPLFRLTNMCYNFMGIKSFIVPPNFLLIEPLNDLILRAREMGLLEFWVKTSYIELVKMGKIYIGKDRRVITKSNMLSFEDFRFLTAFLYYLYATAFVVFLCEIVWFKVSKRRLK